VRRILLAAALLPLIAATAVAGIVSSPSKTRPCLEEYTEGINGQPTHMILGSDGDLYAAEEFQRKILRFDPDTHEAREYPVSLSPHDLTQGPDGRIWFVAAPRNLGRPDRGLYLGALDPKDGELEFFRGLTRGVEPHMLRFNKDGRLYITLQRAGQFAIFDPESEEFEEGRFGLPAGNFIHNIVLLPNGDFWGVLQEGDALARFNFKTKSFDKFVPMPKDSGPRDITYVKSRNALYATLFAANKLAEYDLDTDKVTLHDVDVPPITYKVAVGTSTEDRANPKLTFVRADADEEALWIATLSGGELLRFDPKTGDVENVGCGVTVPSGPLGLVNDRKGRLWVANLFPTGRIAEVKR
jgi:streptogramin lyase